MPGMTDPGRTEILRQVVLPDKAIERIFRASSFTKGAPMAADRPEFRVQFLVEKIAKPFDVTVPPDSPLDRFDGEPGSLLQIAMSAGVPIEHACGGVGACGTCHVIVEGGFDSIKPADDLEQDGLDGAVGLTRQSRLACQAVPAGSADLVVRVPAWNRNLTGERD